MPIKSGKVTAQERAFIDAMAGTGDRVYAAREAGYRQPTRDAGRVLSRPEVQAEIARIQTERLFSEALPAAVTCLVSIITSDKMPAGARVQASKVVLDRTLGGDGAAPTKEPHEMTAEEIAEAISKLEAVAAGRAKPIDQAPAASPNDDVFA